MSVRLIALFLLALLAVLPAAGEASAVPASRHCAQAAHSMAMPGGHHAAARQDCDHGTSRHHLPCAMMGLCSMTGCMAFTEIATPEVVTAGQRVAFVVPPASRPEGLALTPPLEPPRA